MFDLTGGLNSFPQVQLLNLKNRVTIPLSVTEITNV